MTTSENHTIIWILYNVFQLIRVHGKFSETDLFIYFSLTISLIVTVSKMYIIKLLIRNLSIQNLTQIKEYKRNNNNNGIRLGFTD